MPLFDWGRRGRRASASGSGPAAGDRRSSVRWLVLAGPALAVMIAAAGCGTQPGAGSTTLQPSSVRVVRSASVSPLAGETVSGTIQLAVSADSWAGDVRFYLDAAPAKATPFADDAAPPYDATLDTTALSDGGHSLVVEEVPKDAAVNQPVTVSVPFTVSNGGSSGGGSSGGSGGSGGSGTVYWQYGFENGTVAPLQIWNSGSSSVSVIGSPVHAGSHAAAMTISTASGKSGMRLAVPYLQDGSRLPTSAYYSAWYYFPQRITTSWDNVMQFKQHDNAIDSSNPVWNVSINNRSGSGAMYLTVTSHVGTDGSYNGPGAGQRAAASIDLPVGQWVHLECYYAWSTSNGRVACWQDGTQLWNLTGVQTDYGYAPYNGSGGDLSRQFAVNNYAASTSPASVTIDVDDVSITSAF